MRDLSDLDTLAIHAAQPPDPETGAVMPPIHLSSTFAQDGPGQHRGFEYARTNNPTRQQLERCVAQLEGGAHGIAFASGCAAITAALQLLKPGEHVVACDDVYGGTYRIFERIFVPLGIEVSWVDMTAAGAVAAALKQNTRMIFVETPTNPLLKLVDLSAIGKLAGDRGIPMVVDNTFATPVLQRPLAQGAALVVHSTTKYLNGHSDVVGGALVCRDDGLAERLRFVQNAAGAVPSPFDCFLVLRGIKTLPLRMRRHVELAGALAQWLEGHPRIERVHYPGLSSHPQHALAGTQMAGAGGMVSCVVEGGLEGARQVMAGLRIFTCAESLGGVESLVGHPATMTHAAVPAAQREALGISDGLIRLSVGLEALADLRGDLERALAG
ncbi:MAG: PLP-dependent aspartate aminotransferase family protein [Myxococcales bacterium]|nr:PLP-dependent aspartate aminotransferase family protein [Myxococcales bacterium]